MSKYLKNFFRHTALFLAKYIDQNINDESIKHINEALIEFKRYCSQTC